MAPDQHDFLFLAADHPLAYPGPHIDHHQHRIDTASPVRVTAFSNAQRPEIELCQAYFELAHRPDPGRLPGAELQVG